MDVFQDYAYYYNAFYRDKDYKKEAEQVVHLLEKFEVKGNRILNLGCGTGKHDIELYKMGYQCTGIDISSLMIDIAKQNGNDNKCAIDFRVGDIRHYKSEKEYDAAISLFHVISYQNSNTDVINAFISARKALKENGIFLFDVWYGPGVLSDKPVVRVKEIEDEKNTLIRIAKPIMHDKENLVDVCYEVLVIDKITSICRTINEVHKMRYFFRPELELMLREAGFRLIENLNCENIGKTDYNSWTSYFIAEAI